MSTSRIFITGGASGLGRALAERYARAGWRVLIGDVNEERAEETLAALVGAGATAGRIACDVRREEDLAAAAAWLEREWGGVDVVVNNAGVAMAGGIAEMSLDDWQWIVDINLLGVVRGCKVFTPMLRRQGGGHFVNVASMAGLIHLPHMSAYNATKAAVVAVSESLALELADDGIAVSVVCPAFFRTNLHETMRASNASFSGMTRALLTKARLGADEIAQLVYDAVAKREFHILTHPEGRAVWMLKRLAPFAAYRRVMRRSASVLMSKHR